jgi:hypothetical protein
MQTVNQVNAPDGWTRSLAPSTVDLLVQIGVLEFTHTDKYETETVNNYSPVGQVYED